MSSSSSSTISSPTRSSAKKKLKMDDNKDNNNNDNDNNNAASTSTSTAAASNTPSAAAAPVVQQLPAPLIARILSYNIRSTVDLARLRLVTRNKAVNEHLVDAVVESASSCSSSSNSSAPDNNNNKVGHHRLAIPGRRSPKTKGGAFWNSLILSTQYYDDDDAYGGLGWEYEYFDTGNYFQIPPRMAASYGNKLFEGSTVTRLLCLSGKRDYTGELNYFEEDYDDEMIPPFQLRPKGTTTETTAVNNNKDDMLHQVCHQLEQFKTFKELEGFVNTIEKEGLALPVALTASTTTSRGGQQPRPAARRLDQAMGMRVLLSLTVPANAPCVHQIVRERENDGGGGDDDDEANENVRFLKLQSSAGPSSSSANDDDDTNEVWPSFSIPMCPLDHHSIYMAPVVSFQAAAAAAVAEQDEDNNGNDDQSQDAAPAAADNQVAAAAAGTFEVLVVMDLVCDKEYFEEAVYDWDTLRYLPLEGMWNRYQESHVKVEGVAIVDRLLASKAADTLNQQINALALKQEQENAVDYHPKSNNIVRDIIHPALYAYVKGQSPLRKKVTDVAPCAFPTATTITTMQQDGKDFWGRVYKTSKYQWLPTYFSISACGKCVIEDYINNLSPREDPVHESLYHGLAKLFEQCLPFMETVYGYVLAARLKMDTGGGAKQRFAPKPVSLRDKKLQVITKIVDYELEPGQSHGGVWHVEGMSHEEIVLTVLYIADRDESIDGGDLLFKRAFFVDEASKISMGVAQSRPPPIEKAIHDGLNPIGKVETSKGRLICFPNSHVHKVEEMVNSSIANNEGTKSKRRIVVFFLVNPMRRIVSTREVAPQQSTQGGAMSLEDALAHRLQLMEERKHNKQDWNVPEIHLCEH